MVESKLVDQHCFVANVSDTAIHKLSIVLFSQRLDAW